MLPKLLLFDIDLTLIKTGGAGLGAMHAAMREFTGLQGEVTTISPDGKTDPLIVPELFAANNQPYDDSMYAPFMDAYIARLAALAENPANWILLPGVIALLERIEQTEGLYLGLVTGNDERGARLKLSPFDLNRFFPVGGFASDSAVRRELIPIAIERAEAHYGLPFAREQVIIIGDALGDVACARDENVRCIAVTTGHTSAAELQACGPCTIVADLSASDAMLALFLE